MSREMQLAKSTVILSIGTFIPKFATFITLPILTAFLSKEQYGAYDLISILVSLILPVTTLQIHTAVFRFLIEKKNDRKLAKELFSNTIAFVIPVSVLTLLILYSVLPINDGNTKFWVILYLFFDTLVEEARQVVRGMSNNLDYSISAIVSALIKMVLTFLLVQCLKLELKGAVIALAVSPVVSLFYLIIKDRLFELIDFRLVNKRTITEMLRYSWPMVPNNMSGWVMRASDRFVITAVMGLSSAGIYGVANKIPQLLTLAQTTFSMAWQENASIASKDEDVGAYYSKMFHVMFAFYGGCLGLIIAITPLLFRVLIKGDYAEAYPQMAILFLSIFFSCMSSFLGGIYIAKKATRSVGITTVVASVFNLVIDLLLIRLIGLYAASLSTLISYIVLFTYRMIDIRKIIPIRYDAGKIAKILIVIVLECILCYINTGWVNIVNSLVAVFAFVFFNLSFIQALARKLKGVLGFMR